MTKTGVKKTGLRKTASDGTLHVTGPDAVRALTAVFCEITSWAGGEESMGWLWVEKMDERRAVGAVEMKTEDEVGVAVVDENISSLDSVSKFRETNSFPLVLCHFLQP